ncbi:hypothetical protein [Streptomyces sp. NPDC088180]|uniref:hypothetical protein n=1 Tax=Streptomyces sp. NPDC088180 TaxID=3365837 RepID=UPI0037F67B9A
MADAVSDPEAAHSPETADLLTETARELAPRLLDLLQDDHPARVELRLRAGGERRSQGAA